MTELSPALVRRLPRYFRTLIKFYAKGKERISSDELAGEMELVPSQVRTDLKALGCIGQRSYGYGIPNLYKKIADILQLSDKFTAVIVGSGDIIRAISKTEVFTKRGIKLGAVFTDECERDCYDAPLCMQYSLKEFIRYFEITPPDIVMLGGEHTQVGLLEYLEGKAQNSDKMLEIWNFTSDDLASDTITVKNIHLSDYIMLLCYDAGKTKKD